MGMFAMNVCDSVNSFTVAKKFKYILGYFMNISKIAYSGNRLTNSEIFGTIIGRPSLNL